MSKHEPIERHIAFVWAIGALSGVLLLSVLWFGGAAYAQNEPPLPTLQERQVQALETIASEMARMRRDCR